MKLHLLVLASLCFTLSPSNAFAPFTLTSQTVKNANIKNNHHRRHHVPKPSQLQKLQLYSTAASSSSSNNTNNTNKPIHPIKAKIIKAGMISYIASMCLALPAALLPVKVLHKARILTTLQKELISCDLGCFCSKWIMRLIPFASVNVMSENNVNVNEINSHENRHANRHENYKCSQTTEPTIWVCNHTSMLDIFFLLAKDKRLRGKNKRPIKIIYWKDLEKNPVTKLLFTMSGFIPVEMEDNGSGSANTYKKSSFKALLKSIKQAFEDGFE